MFTLSIIQMALPTLLIGLLPMPCSASPPLLLLLLRIAQGAAIGGEIAWGLELTTVEASPPVGSASPAAPSRRADRRHPLSGLLAATAIRPRHEPGRRERLGLARPSCSAACSASSP